MRLAAASPRASRTHRSVATAIPIPRRTREAPSSLRAPRGARRESRPVQPHRTAGRRRARAARASETCRFLPPGTAPPTRRRPRTRRRTARSSRARRRQPPSRRTRRAENTSTSRRARPRLRGRTPWRHRCRRASRARRAAAPDPSCGASGARLESPRRRPRVRRPARRGRCRTTSSRPVRSRRGPRRTRRRARSAARRPARAGPPQRAPRRAATRPVATDRRRASSLMRSAVPLRPEPHRRLRRARSGCRCRRRRVRREAGRRSPQPSLLATPHALPARRR